MKSASDMKARFIYFFYMNEMQHLKKEASWYKKSCHMLILPFPPLATFQRAAMSTQIKQCMLSKLIFLSDLVQV